MNRVAWCAGLGAWLVLGLGVVAAQESYALKENAHGGETFTVHTFFEMAMTTHVKVGEQELLQKVLTRKEEVIGEQVLAVEAGRPAKIRRHFVSQRETNENSQRPGAVTQDGPDAGRIFVVTGTGAKRQVTCLNDEMDAATRKRVKHNPQGQILPGRAVAVGEAWEVPAEVLKALFYDDAENPPEAVSIKCRFVGVEDWQGVKCARVAVELSVRVKVGTAVETSMNLGGEAHFGLDTGLFLGWELKGKATVQGENAGPDGQPAAMTGDGPITLRESWVPGAADLGDENRKLGRKEPAGDGVVAPEK